MKKFLLQFLKSLQSSFKDLLPIILVIGFFQLVVLQQGVPQFGQILVGGLMVLMGLSLFVQGLQLALFPLGEEMAYSFVKKGSLSLLLLFAFTLGFGTTVAEPALIAIADEAATIAAGGGVIENNDAARESYATGLRLVVALAVGIALLVGVIRILKGWPVQYLIIGGYVGVVIMTAFAPKWIIGIAYDSGGVTTSTVTVPLVAALGIGLANSIRGRDPLIDGFGLIAFASLTPMIFVMAYGMVFCGGGDGRNNSFRTHRNRAAGRRSAHCRDPDRVPGDRSAAPNPSSWPSSHGPVFRPDRAGLVSGGPGTGPVPARTPDGRTTDPAHLHLR